jgi:hypothetical protein
MSSRVSWLMVILVALVIGSPARAEPSSQQPLGLADFAYSMPLTSEPGRAVQTVLVPVDVYRNVLRKDLGDVRVFSASGEEVPHAVRRLTELAEQELPSRSLPLFPLRETGERVGLKDLEVHVRQAADGSIVDIRSVQPDDSTEDDGGRIVAYIADMSATKQPVASIDIKLGETDESYVLPIRVEASNDLTNWSEVAAGQTLARLEFEGNRIEHQRIELTSTRSKYLRITWVADALPAAITEVEAQFQRPRVIQERLSITVRGTRVEREKNVYDFDAGGFVPADRARVLLPATNTLVKATLSSSDTQEGPWTRVSDGRVYRIVEQGQELTSPAVTIPTRSVRYWRMQIHTGNGDLEPDAPTLVLSYFPEQLLFVSKEQAVHHLAYGSYKVEPSKFTVADIVGVLPKSERKALPTETATPGPTQPRGGEAAVTEPPPPAPIKTYLLWAVLILSALTLGLLAARLMRNVR